MFYVSDISGGLYQITDTEDGIKEFWSRNELENLYKKSKVRIHGLSFTKDGKLVRGIKCHPVLINASKEMEDGVPKLAKFINKALGVEVPILVTGVHPIALSYFNGLEGRCLYLDDLLKSDDLFVEFYEDQNKYNQLISVYNKYNKS